MEEKILNLLTECLGYALAALSWRSVFWWYLVMSHVIVCRSMPKKWIYKITKTYTWHIKMLGTMRRTVLWVFWCILSVTCIWKVIWLVKPNSLNPLFSHLKELKTKALCNIITYTCTQLKAWGKWDRASVFIWIINSWITYQTRQQVVIGRCSTPSELHPLSKLVSSSLTAKVKTPFINKWSISLQICMHKTEVHLGFYSLSPSLHLCLLPCQHVHTHSVWLSKCKCKIHHCVLANLCSISAIN